MENERLSWRWNLEEKCHIQMIMIWWSKGLYRSSDLRRRPRPLVPPLETDKASREDAGIIRWLMGTQLRRAFCAPDGWRQCTSGFPECSLHSWVKAIQHKLHLVLSRNLMSAFNASFGFLLEWSFWKTITCLLNVNVLSCEFWGENPHRVWKPTGNLEKRCRCVQNFFIFPLILIAGKSHKMHNHLTSVYVDSFSTTQARNKREMTVTCRNFHYLFLLCFVRLI